MSSSIAPSLSYCCERDGFLTHPDTHHLGQADRLVSSQCAPISASQSLDFRHVQPCSAFTWVLGIQAQVLRVAEQVLSATESSTHSSELILKVLCL